MCCFVRFEGESWQSQIPRRTTQEFMCVWQPTWLERGKVKRLNFQCSVNVWHTTQKASFISQITLLARKGFTTQSKVYLATMLCVLPHPERPVFVQRPVNQVVLVDESVEFRCHVHGDPPPTLRWKKEDVDISRGRWRMRAWVVWFICVCVPSCLWVHIKTVEAIT